jgi:flavin reductase (DIM6/NTAB) family NADH-FMN oxidoreductase RutF
MDQQAISTIFAQLDREIWLVTASAGDRRGGLIATFVSHASIVPQLPRVLVGIAKQHHTWQLIQGSGAFAMHLLDEEHIAWVWQFGLHSGRDVDKFADLAWQTGLHGAPLLQDALAWLECGVEATLDTGDRSIYLAEVLDGHINRSSVPLTFKRLLQFAPADKLRSLKEGLARDGAIDAAAIQEWRSRTGTR